MIDATIRPHIAPLIAAARVLDSDLFHAVKDFNNLHEDAPLTEREVTMLHLLRSIYAREQEFIKQRYIAALEDILRFAKLKLELDIKDLLPEIKS